jgi:hypothetical protein
VKTVILFYTSTSAIRGAKKLKELGIPNTLASVPRELSSDCGYCIKLEPADEDRAINCLAEHGIEFSSTASINE